MTRTGLINGVAATAAVLLAVAATLLGARPRAVQPLVPVSGPLADVVYVERADGERAVVDAMGTPVAVAPYVRIVSGSTVTDWILAELSAPERVLAYTERGATAAPWRRRFAGKRTLATLDNLEALLALEPDLVVADSFGDPRRLARLRERGLAVFDVGELRGVSSLVPAIHRLGALLGEEDDAARMSWRFVRSLEGIARDVPESERRQGMYVGAYGNKLYGGTVGTSYHDVLVYAGLIDAAAATHRDWPEYSAEALLALDPELLVTRTGMARVICNRPGLGRLRACTVPGSIVELDGFVLDDPGQGIMNAAEAIHTAVYGAGGR